MDRIILLLVLTVLGLPVGAQTIYKCTGPKGDKVYQSFPCAGDKPAEKQWQTEQSSVTWDDYYKRRAADQKIERDRRHMRRRASQVTSSGGPIGTAVGSSANGSACQAAKANREATLNAVGLDRSYSLLRSLDDAVWQACN